MENTNGYHKFSKRHPLVSWDATKYIPSLIENILNQWKIQGLYIFVPCFIILFQFNVNSFRILSFTMPYL